MEGACLLRVLPRLQDVQGWSAQRRSGDAAEDGQMDAATAASLAGSEGNVESSSKDGGMPGGDMASFSD